MPAPTTVPTTPAESDSSQRGGSSSQPTIDERLSRMALGQMSVEEITATILRYRTLLMKAFLSIDDNKSATLGDEIWAELYGGPSEAAPCEDITLALSELQAKEVK